jgi:adenylate kinase family enzyme
MTIGLIASGKSTWSKQFVKENKNTYRVSRDDLRFMTTDYDYTSENEKIIDSLYRSIIKDLLINTDKDIIFDEMNLDKDRREKFKNWVWSITDKLDQEIEFIEKEFPIIGLVFGEIFQEDNGFTLEIEAYEDRYSTKIDTFIEIKTIEKAKAIAEKEIINSMVGGWTTMLFAQIVIPFLSFTIRSLIGSFMLPRYKINILGSFSRSKLIPIMLLMFVGSVLFFALFSWVAKEYSLYASVTTGFLYINFYLTGIVTTLSWVAFVLERQNPYKIHDNYGPES